jgi:Na+-translocating ferredoxin:NAD+ oxidoreductase RnfA subunit
MESYLLIIVGTVLVNNIVLTLILGLCPFIEGSKKLVMSVAKGPVSVCGLTNGFGAICTHYFPHVRIASAATGSVEPGLHGSQG